MKNICAELNGAGYRTINGCLFQEASLHHMIKNEVYAGDILRQKCHISDPISKKKVRNKGELPMYYQTDAHEAIIDRETYARVQAEIRRRESLVPPNYPFTGKITCGICGAHFTRKKSVYKGKCTVRWICRSKKEVGRTCTSINILEEQLASAAAFVLGDDAFDAEQFEMQVKAMTVLKDGSNINVHILPLCYDELACKHDERNRKSGKSERKNDFFFSGFSVTAEQENQTCER